MAAKRNKCYYVGSNFYGQIGNGIGPDLSFYIKASITKKDELTEITTLPDEEIIDIQTGRDNVYYLLSNNECFVAGNNDKQQLLTTTETMKKICLVWSNHLFVPWDVCYLILLFVKTNEFIKCVAILSPICIHNNTKSISKGVVSDHRFLIKQSNHELYGVGSNHSNQFNIGNIDSDDIEIDINTLNFVQIDYFKENNIELKQIHCSMGYSMFLTTRGQLYVCGTSTGGGLGLGKRIEFKTVTKSEGIKLISFFNSNIQIKDVCCGCDHTLALTQHSKLYSWGWNGNGQLGLNHSNDTDTPQLIISLRNKDIVMISSGYQHNLILDKQGNIYCFGDNYYYQCGIEGSNIYVPTEISTLNQDKQVNITDIKCGAYHNVICSCFNESNHYYLWGDNKYHQCLVFEDDGHGISLIIEKPTEYQYIATNYRIIAIYPGNSETRIVTQRF